MRITPVLTRCAASRRVRPAIATQIPQQRGDAERGFHRDWLCGIRSVLDEQPSGPLSTRSEGWGTTVDEATREFLTRLLKLRERMSPESIADFLRDAPRPPPPPPPPPFGGPPVLGIGWLGWTLIAAAAVALAAYRIKNALDETGATTVGAPGPDCGNPAMATTTLAPVTGRSFWGGTAAFNNAIEEAEKVCAALSPLCTGNCETGTCKATLSVQEVTYPWPWNPAWASCQITFRAPCSCV